MFIFILLCAAIVVFAVGFFTGWYFAVGATLEYSVNEVDKLLKKDWDYT